MTQPLNPGLFKYMQDRFDSVRIANQGIPLAWHFEEAPTPLGFDVAVSPGHEHYVTFCPVCDYHRPTLWVSYMFLQKVNLFRDAPMPLWHHIMNLACCYHCHCEDDKRGIVPRQVWNLGRSTEERPSSELIYLFELYFDRVDQGKAVNLSRLPEPVEGSLVERIPLPKCKKLAELPANHAAIDYLLNGRKVPVDPGYISDVYDVRFCDHYIPCDGPEDVTALTHQRAYNRLIFPFYRDGELVTWQMRVCQPEDTRPRWLFPPGQGQHFYNWDYAKDYRGVILVEGVFDCFAAGPSALGVCTSNLSLRRCKEIATQWDYVVIALDPKEFQKEIEDGNGRKRVGHAYLIQERLQEAGIRFPPALIDYGTLSDDPADLGPARFDQLLRDSLQMNLEYYKAVRSLREEAA